MKYKIFLLALVFLLAACSSQNTQETTITPTPTRFIIPSITPTLSITATPMATSEYTCGGSSTVEIRRCLAGKIDIASEELNLLLEDLDKHYPNGSWEEKYNEWHMPQDEWEVLMPAYCEYDVKEWTGGSGHRNAYLGCVLRETLARIEELEEYACGWFEGFSTCPPSNHKPGGEWPVLTAVPTQTATPAP